MTSAEVTGQHETCEHCLQECDRSVCWCGGEPGDAEHHHPEEYTHPFVPYGCDCLRHVGRVVIEIGGALANGSDYLGRGRTVHGNADVEMSRLVASLPWEQAMAEQPSRISPHDCGFRLATESEEIEAVHFGDAEVF